MPKYKFNDKLGNRGRSCRYRIIYEGKAYAAAEAEEQNLAVFVSLIYEKNGKWSNTTWEVLTKSAILVVCMSPFNGWPDNLELCLDHVIMDNDHYTGKAIEREDALIFFKDVYSGEYTSIFSKQKDEENLI